MSIKNKIAKTIKKADRSYFFEDYEKQAIAVIKMLDSSGYKIVPKEPTEEMIEAGDRAVENGKVDPRDLVQQVYRAMIKAAKYTK